jgi:hypothetical protein
MKLGSGIVTGAVIIWLSGCGTPVKHNPLQGDPLNTSPTLARISSIPSSEVTRYWWIMTRIVKDWVRDKIMWICHFSRVLFPSTPEIRDEFENTTKRKWDATGGDVYTVTARHCIDMNMGRVRKDSTIDIVAIRSLNRYWDPNGVKFSSMDRPPVLERSEHDEKSIGATELTLRACIPHASKNSAHCFKMVWRTYSEWMYGQRRFYYRIADLIPFLDQAGRSCENDATVSWTSWMIVTEWEKAYAVVSNNIDMCKLTIRWQTIWLLWIEPLRNTANSLPGIPWKTHIIPN